MTPSIRDVIMKEKESDIKYREEQLFQVKERYSKIELIIEELESITVLTPYYVGISGLRFMHQTEEEASKLVASLVSQFPPEKVGSFQKVFDTGNGGWYWRAPLFGKMVIDVHPAPASRDCIPVEEERIFKSWVCRKKGE